jgi:hypothetical protein
MKKKNTKKWKHNGLKKFGTLSPKPNLNYKLKIKLRKLFRMNYDGK